MELTTVKSVKWFFYYANIHSSFSIINVYNFGTTACSTHGIKVNSDSNKVSSHDCTCSIFYLRVKLFFCTK